MLLEHLYPPPERSGTRWTLLVQSAGESALRARLGTITPDQFREGARAVNLLCQGTTMVGVEEAMAAVGEVYNARSVGQLVSCLIENRVLPAPPRLSKYRASQDSQQTVAALAGGSGQTAGSGNRQAAQEAYSIRDAYVRGILSVGHDRSDLIFRAPVYREPPTLNANQQRRLAAYMKEGENDRKHVLRTIAELYKARNLAELVAKHIVWHGVEGPISKMPITPRPEAMAMIAGVALGHQLKDAARLIGHPSAASRLYEWLAPLDAGPPLGKTLVQSFEQGVCSIGVPFRPQEYATLTAEQPLRYSWVGGGELLAP